MVRASVRMLWIVLDANRMGGDALRPVPEEEEVFMY
jgi:hypothetical protein